MNAKKKPSLLGDYQFTPYLFPNLETVFSSFEKKEFQKLSSRKRFKKINRTLLELIEKEPMEAFLLPAVIDYIDRVNQKQLLQEKYLFVNFEFWLAHYSKVSKEDAMVVRSKIVGKHLSRESYQAIFPIGMNKSYPGTHFVCAHLSPDADTTIASFWGWLDAFGASVSEGLHIWSLPGGPPTSHITDIFEHFFGQSFFSILASDKTMLSLSARDLLTQKRFVKKRAQTQTQQIEHGSEDKAVVLVNEQGHYQGDWRISDVESVGQIVINFNSLLRWFENQLHSCLICFFTKSNPSKEVLESELGNLLNITLKEGESVKILTEKHKRYLNLYLKKVLNVKSGLSGSFFDIFASLKEKGLEEFSNVESHLFDLSKLFDKKGTLKKSLADIFKALQKVITSLDLAIQALRDHTYTLEMMMETKHLVLGEIPEFVTLQTSVEEIKSKMKNHSYLTVAIPEEENKWFPVGVVHAKDLQKSTLGTVSLRDFCNFDEVKMPSSLEVISVIDHHKSALKTSSAPSALISDAQSCNILLAEKAFEMNDLHSLGGMDRISIEKEIENLSKELKRADTPYLLKKLLQKKLASNSSQEFFIHPDREFVEYLCFLYAILDDTDLLSKVSARDVVCVAELLNRLKSLSEKKEVMAVSLDHIEKGSSFAKEAAKHILQNEDMYSLYRSIYAYKEKLVDEEIKLCAKNKPSNFFADTKEQNGCCRVGQAKLFASNISLFQKNLLEIRKIWQNHSKNSVEKSNEIDLHLMMVSTITSAKEVYQGKETAYDHQDEIWLWTPETSLSTAHLSSFLNAFQHAKELEKNPIEVEIFGENQEELKRIFARNFKQAKIKVSHSKELSMAVIKFTAGTINSRKAAITPHLPKLIS